MNTNLYKIECQSKTDALIVSQIIDGNNGKCVVEGTAVVSDYSFNELEADVCLACVKKMVPYEDLTVVDIRAFDGAL